jgi:hypothetical protein
MTIGKANAIESGTVAPEPTRASVPQQELREAKRLWLELRRNSDARNRSSHDWNQRRNALASTIGDVSGHGCVQDPLCAARLQISLAVAEMLGFFSVEGEDRELKKSIPESLEKTESGLNDVN